jgi:hypothetical protein
MVSQGYKEIPKTIRTNWTALILFEIANDKEVLVIYEENTMGYKKDEWLEMFRHATKDDYSFMYLNSKKPRELRCMKNFDKVLFSAHDDGDRFAEETSGGMHFSAEESREPPKKKRK